MKRRQRVVARLAAAAVAGAALAGCSLGDKEALAREVLDSVELLEAAGPMQGSLRVTVAIVALPAGLEAPSGVPDEAQAAAAPPIGQAAAVPLQVDLRAERAALGPADHPTAIFDALDTYGRRLDAAAGDARPWMKVDLADLADGDTEVDYLSISPIGLASALNPSVLLDLIAGALTGSVERATGDEVGGVATRAYTANFDVEKALERSRRERYPEDERDALYDALDLLTVTRRVHPGTVWIDGDGIPRRFKVDLRVSPRKGFLMDVGLDLELLEPATAVPTPPGELELLETSSLGGFLQAVSPRAARP